MRNEEESVANISIEVKEENLELLLTILQNLRSGLIEKIDVDEKKYKKHTQYQPKADGIIHSEEPIRGKYVDPNTFKRRLAKR